MTSNASSGYSLSGIKTTAQTEAAEAEGGTDEEAIYFAIQFCVGGTAKGAVTMEKRREKGAQANVSAAVGVQKREYPTTTHAISFD